MKTVILDRCTVISHGDVSLEPIERLGETAVYDMLGEEEIIAAAGDADAIICNKAQITERIMGGCRRLKFIGLFATGYNNIDLAAANRHGICVANVPGYSTDSVTQHTFGLMLALAGSICRYNSSVHSGEWCRSAAFTYLTEPLTEIAGKTLGIFGFGAIGKSVARAASGFGMRVIVCTRTQPDDCEYELVPRDELFRRSDFLSLHCPLNDGTRELVNRGTLALMKPTAYLINTSRGGVVNEADLCDALLRGVIAGAGLDVVTVEPMREDNPLLAAPNLVVTPHIAWATLEARERLVRMVADNLRAFADGSPVNTVNSPLRK